MDRAATRSHPRDCDACPSGAPRRLPEVRAGQVDHSGVLALLLVVLSILSAWGLTFFPSDSTVVAPLVTVAALSGLLAFRRQGSALQAASAARAEALARVRAADAAKSRFLSLVSRELRAPIDTILAQGESVASGPAPVAGQVIVLQARRLLSSVDALLDFAALGRGPVSLREVRVPLGPLIAEVVTEVEGAIAPSVRGVRVDPLLAELVLTADRRAIRQVLLQLVGNAARFTGHEDWIDLRLERERDQLLLVIEDEGVGIAPEDQARVLDAFERAGTPVLVRGGSGLGLGLAICRALIEAHGGRIELDSVEGVGTRVMVILPASREQMGPEPAPTGPDAAAAVTARAPGLPADPRPATAAACAGGS